MPQCANAKATPYWTFRSYFLISIFTCHTEGKHSRWQTRYCLFRSRAAREQRVLPTITPSGLSMGIILKINFSRSSCRKKQSIKCRMNWLQVPAYLSTSTRSRQKVKNTILIKGINKQMVNKSIYINKYHYPRTRRLTGVNSSSQNNSRFLKYANKKK